MCALIFCYRIFLCLQAFSFVRRFPRYCLYESIGKKTEKRNVFNILSTKHVATKHVHIFIWHHMTWTIGLKSIRCHRWWRPLSYSSKRAGSPSKKNFMLVFNLFFVCFRTFDWIPWCLYEQLNSNAPGVWYLNPSFSFLLCFSFYCFHVKIFWLRSSRCFWAFEL